MPMIIGGEEDNIVFYDLEKQTYYLFDGDMKMNKKLETKRYGPFIQNGGGYHPGTKKILGTFAFFVNVNVIEFKTFTRKIGEKKLHNEVICRLKKWVKSSKQQWIIGYPFHTKIIDDYIYMLRTDEYRLSKMDLEGKVIKEIKVTNIDKKSFSNSTRSEWIRQSLLKDPVRFIFPGELWSACWLLDLGDGIAVGRRKNYKPTDVEWIEADYFDKNLNYLGKIEVPGFSHWNDPALGQERLDFLFHFQNDKLFMIDIRETEEGEDFWLTRWRQESEKR
ncbi:MAG: hypothetical protein KAW12_22450 [Candidatus Aminicenantes bacterium]|nr:hypothetical protein [Candidatus Aminicenantes bacterium]